MCTINCGGDQGLCVFGQDDSYEEKFQLAMQPHLHAGLAKSAGLLPCTGLPTHSPLLVPPS